MLEHSGKALQLEAVWSDFTQTWEFEWTESALSGGVSSLSHLHVLKVPCVLSFTHTTTVPPTEDQVFKYLRFLSFRPEHHAKAQGPLNSVYFLPLLVLGKCDLTLFTMKFFACVMCEMCACLWVHICEHACACGGLKLTSDVFLNDIPSTLSWKQGLSVEPTNWTYLSI